MPSFEASRHVKAARSFCLLLHCIWVAAASEAESRDAFVPENSLAHTRTVFWQSAVVAGEDDFKFLVLALASSL